jgi:hypothetical protein
MLSFLESAIQITIMNNNNNNNNKEKRKMKRKKQFPRSLDEKLVDKEQSYRWLKFGNIKGETESTIVAAQDQAISTNYFKRKILKEEIDRFRLCKEYEETTDHLTSGCPILAMNEYVIMSKPIYQHEDITVLWNQRTRTDRAVLANRPNIIINKTFWKELICLLSLHYLKISFALKPAFAPT